MENDFCAMFVSKDIENEKRRQNRRRRKKYIDREHMELSMSIDEFMNCVGQSTETS